MKLCGFEVGLDRPLFLIAGPCVIESEALVQEVAEVLAGLAYVNAIKPGAPAIFGLWPFVSDLRSGAMSGGSPEQALLSSACAQMAHFYGAAPMALTRPASPPGRR